MTYKEKFVAVVKSKGKILREDGNTVRVPFGSEYSIYMKNLNSRKAVVDVSVDGKDALDGNQIVLDAGQSLNLKGWMKGMKARNKFRFIKKTKQIQRHRGDRIDDGVVRVEFRFEKKIEEDPWRYYSPPIKPWGGSGVKTYFNDNSSGGWSNNTQVTYSASFSNSSSTLSSRSKSVKRSSAPKSDEGITVKGSLTNQQFHYANVGELEPSSEVIILRLVGRTSRGKKVKRPITTKTKITCPTCGRRWRSSMKFCGNCSSYMR
jgi:hypothetical protein